jgi:hypothetical protein
MPSPPDLFGDSPNLFGDGATVNEHAHSVCKIAKSGTVDVKARSRSRAGSQAADRRLISVPATPFFRTADVFKRIGWIVFVLILTAFILAGGYRAMHHQEARPPTPHTPPYR